jgi:hypothetical protein
MEFFSYHREMRDRAWVLLKKYMCLRAKSPASGTADLGLTSVADAASLKNTAGFMITRLARSNDCPGGFYSGSAGASEMSMRNPCINRNITAMDHARGRVRLRISLIFSGKAPGLFFPALGPVCPQPVGQIKANR